MAVRSEPDEFRVVLRGKQRGKKCLKLLIWSGNIGGKITQGLVLCSVRGERSFLLLVCHKRAWSWCFICDAHVCEACVSADGAAARQDAWAPALFSFESPHTKHEDLHSRCWLVCFLPVFTSLLRFNTLSTPTTTTHKHTHTQAHTHTVLPIRNSLLSLITFIFSGLEFPLSVPEEMDFFPPLPTCRKSLTHITLAPRSKQVSWLVLLYILWFNKENTNVSQREQCWWYQCHAFHWFLFTWCPQDTRWLVALHTWPGNFVHLTGSRRVLWRSEKRQRDKN